MAKLTHYESLYKTLDKKEGEKREQCKLAQAIEK